MARKSKTPAKRGAKKPPAAPGRGRGRIWLGRIAYWSFLLALWGAIGIFGLFVWYAYDLPDATQLGRATDRPVVRLLAADGRLARAEVASARLRDGTLTVRFAPETVGG